MRARLMPTDSCRHAIAFSADGIRKACAYDKMQKMRRCRAAATPSYYVAMFRLRAFAIFAAAAARR